MKMIGILENDSLYQHKNPIKKKKHEQNKYYQLRCPLGQNQQFRKEGRTGKYTTCIDPLVCTQIQGNIESRQDAHHINLVVFDTAD